MFEVFKQDNNAASYTSKRIVSSVKKRDKSLSHPAFKALVAVNIFGALIAAYLYFNRPETPVITDYSTDVSTETKSVEKPTVVKQSTIAAVPVKQVPPVITATALVKKDTITAAPIVAKKADPIASPALQMRTKPIPPAPSTAVTHAENNPHSSDITETISYTVAGPQVYFHNKPDERTRRNAFINRWNKAVLKPLDEENGFVYIVYTNQWGQTSKGWMLKKQLKPIN